MKSLRLALVGLGVAVALSACLPGSGLTPAEVQDVFQSQVRADIEKARESTLRSVGDSQQARDMVDNIVGKSENVVVSDMVVHEQSKTDKGDIVVKVSFKMTDSEGSGPRELDGRMTFTKMGDKYKLVNFERM